jgi:hypothetical protein
VGYIAGMPRARSHLPCIWHLRRPRLLLPQIRGRSWVVGALGLSKTSDVGPLQREGKILKVASYRPEGRATEPDADLDGWDPRKGASARDQ